MYMVCFLLLEDDSVQLEALVMTKVLVEKQVRSKRPVPEVLLLEACLRRGFDSCGVILTESKRPISE